MEKIILNTPDRFIDIGHSQVPLYSLGKGPDLLFVHGWPMTANTYRFALPELSKHFRCHLIDLPGSGKSRFDKKTPIDFMSHAESVKRVVQKIGFDRYALVGHDSGGAIARYVTASDDKVAALVLSGTEIPDHHPTFVSQLQFAARLPFFESIARVAFRSRMLLRSNYGFGGGFYDRSRIDDEFDALFIQPMVQHGPLMYGALELLRTLKPSFVNNLAGAHAKIKVPVQLVWGEKDPFFPLEKARDMAAQFVDASLESVPKAKLMVHEEHPKEFARAAIKTLKRGFESKPSKASVG